MIVLYIPQCIYFYVSSKIIGRWFSISLHSTMYLFLLYFHISEKFQSYNFTFHNVSISTVSNCPFMRSHSSLHSTMYLFLPNTFQIDGNSTNLYIPQCIYFYISCRNRLNSFIILYIPQCIYFYPPDRIFKYLVNNLYIPQCIYFYPSNLLTLKYSDYIPCFVDFLPYINSITNLYL